MESSARLRIPEQLEQLSELSSVGGDGSPSQHSTVRQLPENQIARDRRKFDKKIVRGGLNITASQLF